MFFLATLLWILPVFLVFTCYVFFAQGLVWQFFPRLWEWCVRYSPFRDLLEAVLINLFLSLFPYGLVFVLELLASLSMRDFAQVLLWHVPEHSIFLCATYEPFSPKGEVRIPRFVYVPPEHVVGSSLPHYLHGGLAGNPSDPFEYFLLYYWPYPPEDWANPYHPRILFPYIHTYPEPKDQESEEITDTLTELIYDAYGRPKTPDDYGKAFAVTFLAFQFGYAVGFGLTALSHWLSSGK